MNLAVVGLGFMGATHIKALRSVPGARLAAVYSRDPKKLAGDLSEVRGNIRTPGEGANFSGATAYSDLDALMSDSSINAVDICLPTNLHEEVAVKALRAGKHVLVEKPMALDGACADHMLAVAESTARVLMTAHVLRFWPSYESLVETTRQGRLGPMRHASFRRRCAAPGWSRWLREPSESGGGVFDLLIHDVDMCLHLFGKPEAVAATGYSDAAAGIDIIHSQLYYADRSVTSLSGGWQHPPAFPFSMEYTVTFEGGTLDFSSEGRPATLFASGQPPSVLDAPDRDAYAAEIQYFVECCRRGERPELCPPDQSAAAVKLALQMLEARSRNGERIACRI